MKMVKSLLLGSAAGVVAMAGAQAADLPVKAKPVQYVKICSLYGAGFYYIPGTNTCIKIGGFVRAEINVNASHSFSVLTGDRSLRTFDWERTRARGVITFDTRSQTEYGTLRSYLTAGHQVSSGRGGSSGVFQTGTYMNRAFIQWAGFTAGLSGSFFDFFTFAKYSNQTNWLTSDIGGAGTIVFAYTAQFGNGLSASVSAEDTNGRGRLGASTAGIFGQTYGGREWPDFIGNLRIDQAWGSAQIMGAVHQVRGSASGDMAGWAVGAGLSLNLPWAKGDNISVQAAYSRGAVMYTLAGIPTGGFFVSNNGTTFAYGNGYDAVTNATTGGLELTESWSVGAGGVHHWNSMWQTSLYGGYGEVNYNAAATTALTGNPDWSFAQVGSRTVWTPVKNLALSVDVLYNHIGTATSSGGVAQTNSGDVGWVSGIFRVQRNFWP